MTAEDGFVAPERSCTSDNAYYFECELMGQRPSYYVCLHKIKRHESGPLPELFAVCSDAMDKGRCPAVLMRERELLEGRAIYFEQRRVPTAEDRPMAKRPWAAPRASVTLIPRSTPSAPRAPKPAPSESTPVRAPVQRLDFAEIVNDLSKNPTEPPIRPVEPPKAAAAPSDTPKQAEPAVAPAKSSPIGESLIEMARRLKAQKKSLTTD